MSDKTQKSFASLKGWLLAVGGALLATGTVYAAGPDTLTYQGRVNVGGQVFSGNGQFKFALVNSGANLARPATATAVITSGFVTSINVTDGGNGYTSPPVVTITGGGGAGATATTTIGGGAITGITVKTPGSGYATAPAVNIAPPSSALVYLTYWSHDGTSSAGGPPASAITLPVANGLFVTPLGDTNLMAALPAEVFTNPAVRLRIWFNDGTNGLAQLVPDQTLTATPYALLAQSAGSAAQLTGSLPVAQLSGTLGSAQISGTYGAPVALTNPGNAFTGNGAGLTSLNAAQLTSGGMADARLSGNVALRNGTNVFSGSNTFANVVVATNGNNLWKGTLTGSLIGVASSAGSFTGVLAGDVTGTQGATVVALVGGQTAANVAAGTTAANGAASANTPNGIVKRDAAGGFAAGTLAGTNFIGNGVNLTNLNAAQLLAGTLPDGRLSPNVALLNANQNFGGSNNFTGVIGATNVNNAFRGTLTGSLLGNAATATLANNFSGSLAGDVTGAQGATVVALVGGQTAATIASGAVSANAATSANTPNAIVKRDAAGGISAGVIAAIFSGNGAALTNLNAGNLASGILPDARHSTNVPLLNVSNNFSAILKAAGGLIIENRTSDPVSPAVGQIWLRTDLP